MKKSIVVYGMLALTLSAPLYAQANKELDDTIAQAETGITAAKKMNNLWRDTEKFLEESKKLKAAGKMDEAIKLAKKALSEATHAQKQAQDQASAKPSY